MKVDFHIHTNVSDGHFTPEGVLELALKQRLRLLAITDHDAIEGFDRAGTRLEERRAAGSDGAAQLELLAGVETETIVEAAAGAASARRSAIARPPARASAPLPR